MGVILKVIQGVKGGKVLLPPQELWKGCFIDYLRNNKCKIWILVLCIIKCITSYVTPLSVPVSQGMRSWTTLWAQPHSLVHKSSADRPTFQSGLGPNMVRKDMRWRDRSTENSAEGAARLRRERRVCKVVSLPGISQSFRDLRTTYMYNRSQQDSSHEASNNCLKLQVLQSDSELRSSSVQSLYEEPLKHNVLSDPMSSDLNSNKNIPYFNSWESKASDDHLTFVLWTSVPSFCIY